MAVGFIQQSEEYIRQIEAEIKRLEQLRDQVRAVVAGDEQLEERGPAARKSRRYAATKGAAKKAPSRKAAAKKAAATKAPAKRRGRQRIAETPAEA